MATSVTAADLLGAWQLVGWEIDYADGRITHPFGRDPVGLLVYSADGWMNVCIAVRDRPRFDEPDVRRAPLEQQAAAFASYFSYAGRYEVSDGVVTHHADIALNPGFVGSRQVRRIDLHGSDLVLSADEPGPSGARRHALSWRRAGGPNHQEWRTR